ncbi:MAG: VWA domain-containing protein [Hyphomicrobiaceae bacterium]
MFRRVLGNNACGNHEVSAAPCSAPGLLPRLRKDEAGGVAIAFGLMAVTLTGLVGAAVDISRWQQARNVTMSAVDAGVLAAARQLQIDNQDPAAALAAADAMYRANTNERLAVEDDTISFEIGSDGASVRGRGSAFIRTPFLALASVERLPLMQLSGGEYSEAMAMQGRFARRSLEVSVMLDVTGSMAGEKIEALKEAATDLVEIVVWENQTSSTSKVALVPFSDSVKPGALLQAVRADSPSSRTVRDSSGRWQTFKRTECVSERGGGPAHTDAAPIDAAKLNPVYTRNATCNPSTPIMPLTNNKDALKGAISTLAANGWTAGQLGTAWSWYMLSPEWAGVLPGESRPAAYSDDSVRKVAVLMTDGEYNTQYDAAGISTRDTGAAPMNGASDAQARKLCEGMKASGIEVYTVGFALTEAQAVETMGKCASSKQHAYIAQSSEQLRQAFRDIALKLSPVHLTH